MSVSKVKVGDDGILLQGATDIVVDVLLDGRRVWSFRPQRDGEFRLGGRLVPWPEALADFLDGRTELTLTEHATGEEIFREEVRLGTSDRRIAFVSADGRPLALDKDLRRVHTFDTRSADHVRPLLDAIEQVLGSLRALGVEGFLAYGTLLGAVRDGRLIGHDSDADLGYVSRHSSPADVSRESFALQRGLAEAGFQILRYSGAAFRVEVTESDGTRRGLDVFGGFVRDGHLHLMGEIRAPFDDDAIHPLGTAELEGRSFPVPRDTDRFLAATYGPGWRVPDPAFHFETPTSTSRRLSGWFRGFFTSRPLWDRAYADAAFDRVEGASGFARWIASREPDLGSYVDLGCGRGRDVAFMGRRGVRSLGLDVHPRSFFVQAEQNADNPLVDFATCNLLEQRHVAVAVARAALLPRPQVLAVRHLVDGVNTDGRRQLWRTARGMLTGPDDRLYLRFICEEGADDAAAALRVEPVEPALVREELEAAGARLLHEDVVPVSDQRSASKACRIVAQWNR